MATDEHVPDADQLREVTQDRVTVDGDPIHYLQAGEDGPPLVLLHGGIIDAAHISWAPQLDTLADEARVYAPNLPGYGPNPMPDDGLSIPRHVRTVAGFLEWMALEDVVVAGISMGGGVAIGLGLEHPERLRHVVALDAMALGSELSGGKLTWLLSKVQVINRLSVALMRRYRSYVRIGLETLVHEDFIVPSELIDLVQREAERPGAGAAFRSLRANEVTWGGYRTDYSDRFGELDVPARLIHGADDEVFPAAWSRRAADAIPEVDVHVLEDCGHLPTWERRETVDDLVAGVL